MEDVPNMEVYTPCPSGHSCRFDCNEGFRRKMNFIGYFMCIESFGSSQEKYVHDISTVYSIL